LKSPVGAAFVEKRVTSSAKRHQISDLQTRLAVQISA
jgi:hypothetical protein